MFKAGLLRPAFFLALFALTIQPAHSQSYETELLLNGGGEATIPGANWTQVGAAWTRSTNGPTPKGGSYYIIAGQTTQDGELYQDIDISAYAAAIDGGTQKFMFSGWVSGFASADLAQVIVEYRSSAGVVLDTYDSGQMTSNKIWLAIGDTRLAPSGTRTVRVRLIGIYNAGSWINANFDGLSLIANDPTPTASYNTELIYDGGGEGAIPGAGWTPVSGAWQEGNASPAPQSGSFYFRAGQTTLDGELHQDVDVSGYASNIDTNTQQFQFAGWVSGFDGNDMSRVMLEYRNAGGTVLETYDSGQMTSSQVWRAVDDTRTAPAGTRSIRVKLMGYYVAGAWTNANFDGLSLMALDSGPAMQWVSYDYDDLGRLKSVAYPDATAVDYSYDPAGNRVAQDIDTPNDAMPSAVNDSMEVFQGIQGSIDPLLNDDDPLTRGLTIASATDGAHGTVTVSPDNLTLSYMASSGYSGADSFTYLVTDGVHTAPAATVSVQVNAIVTFDIQSDQAENEGTSLTFTVTKSVTSAAPQSVTISTADGSALSGTDYTASSAVLDFAPGELSKPFVVSTIPDTVFENDKSFTVTLSAASEGAVIGTGSRTGTITNDDPSPVFAITNAVGIESGDVTVTVTKTGATALTHSVDYQTIASTGPNPATPDVDYTSVSGNLSFAPNVTELTFPITTLDDGIFELDEQIGVSLSIPAGDAATLATPYYDAMLTDDDAAPGFLLQTTPLVTAEGAFMQVTVFCNAETSFVVTVDYSTLSGSAVANEDYTPVSGTLTFDPNVPIAQNFQTFTIPISADSVYEGSAEEEFAISIDNPMGGLVIVPGAGTRTAKITDMTAPPQFSIDDVSVVEGVGLMFTITRSGNTKLAHSVTYATASGTADTTDYTPIAATVLPFPASPTAATQTITVATGPDSAFENDETIFINLTVPTNGAVIQDNQGIGTIKNNDPVPYFTISDASEAEGNNLSFTITRHGNTGLTHNVSYVTANGSATIVDYAQKTLTVLPFEPGSTDLAKTITVLANTDTIFEASEDFFVNLSAQTNNATISDPQGKGTITNVGSEPVFSIGDASGSEGGDLSFTITRSGNTDLVHNITYVTAIGTAGTTDYTPIAATVLSFPASTTTTTQTITVAASPDSIFEASEDFFVNLTNPGNGAQLGDPQGKGTITNVGSEPVFSISNASPVTEGGQLSFQVTKTGTTTQTHSVNYSTADGTATTANSDYTAKTNITLNFSPGQTQQNATVQTTADTDVEEDETVLVNLSNPTNANISVSQGVGTITNDDEINRRPVAVDDGTFTAPPGASITISVLNNDSDPDDHDLTITSVTIPPNGSAFILAGAKTVRFTASSFPTSGSTFFKYTISDGFGGTDTATVFISIPQEDPCGGECN